ncbi:MAG: carboxypeptidase M32, partial [Oligoflexales bacterium]|nr:carboxypeptidase M32 [Oligoflexales bacterium]
HKEKASKKYERLLSAAENETSALDENDPVKVQVRLSRQKFDRIKKLPVKFVKEMAETISLATSEWEKAREKNSWSLFKNSLNKMCQIQRMKSDFWGYENHRYEALIQENERSLSLSEIDYIFDTLKKFLVPFISAIRNKTPVSHNFKNELYPTDFQKEMANCLAEYLSFNQSDGLFATSSHPFCQRLGPRDFRITTRFDERNFISSFLSSAHELGHFLYEKGLPLELYGLPIGETPSAGFHESSALFWEKKIAMSKPFLTRWLLNFRKKFPSLDAIDDLTFYKTVNRINIDPIRLNSDEVTYCIHIVIRYELEKALLGGDLKTDDLKDAWSSKYRDYFDIQPKDDNEGILQDIHWAWGLFGYFPSYALGHVYSSQYAYAMESEIGPFDILIAQEKISEIIEWLDKNIYKRANTLDASMLIKEITGKPIDPIFFCNYLEKKYGEIYEIG